MFPLFKETHHDHDPEQRWQSLPHQAGSRPEARAALVGLGWDARSTNGAEFDLDASAFLLDGNGKIYGTGEQSFVFYNNLATPDKTVTHTGDNRTGDVDDEQVVQLDRIPAAVQKIAITVTIHDA